MTEKVKSIFEDDRPIQILVWPGPGEQHIKTGSDGVEKIIPYYEAGQMADVVWLAVYRNGTLAQRINSAHIDTLSY